MLRLLQHGGRKAASVGIEGPHGVAPGCRSRRPVSWRSAVAERLYLTDDLDIIKLNNKLSIGQVPHEDGISRIEAAYAINIHQTATERDATATASTSHQNGTASHVASLLEATAEAEASTAEYSDFDLWEEIKSCDTWDDVVDIVADECDNMSLRTKVQALTKLNTLARQTLSPRQLPSATAQPGFQQLLKTIYQQVPAMIPLQLTNTLSSLSSLRVKLPQDVQAMFEYKLLAPNFIAGFSARDVTALLHAYVTMGLVPKRSMMDMVGFRALMLLEEGAFQPQGVSMLMHSCAVLGYKNTKLTTAAVTAAAEDLNSYSPQGVSNVTWAAAKLGHFSYAMLTRALNFYVAQPKSFKPQEASNLLWALTQFRLHPGGNFQHFVMALVQQPSLRPADFATLMYSLGMFHVHPGQQILGSLCQRMEARLRDFNAVELCNVFWGLGMLGETTQPIFSRIATLLPDSFEHGQLPDSLLRQAFQGLLCAKLAATAAASAAPSDASGAGPSLGRPPAAIDFPPLMLDTMKRAWISGAHGPAARCSSSSSSLAAAQADGAQPAAAAASSNSNSIADEVAGILRELRVRHDRARPSKDGLVSIDIALRPGPERFVALQVVLEHDHTCNTGQLMGPVHFQRQILERNGWEVKHLRAKDYKMVNAKSRPLFIGELLRGIGIRVPASVAGPAAGTTAAGRGRPQQRPSAGVDDGDVLQQRDTARGADLIMERQVPAGRGSSKRISRQR